MKAGMVISLSKIGVILLMMNMLACSPRSMADKTWMPPAPTRQAVFPDERYQEIRSKWTIQLHPAGRTAGARSGLLLPARGPAEGGGMFPLMVTATLMVDSVIDAGLLYYQNMTGMAPQQADNFRQAYHAGNQLDQYLLIEATLYTLAAENYLDLKRYTIFIEDNRQHKVEPARIVQQAVLSGHLPTMIPEPDQNRSPYADWTQHRKKVFLYFPRKDFYGEPIIGADVHELKMVFILEEGGSGRIEGKWTFP